MSRKPRVSRFRCSRVLQSVLAEKVPYQLIGIDFLGDAVRAWPAMAATADCVHVDLRLVFAVGVAGQGDMRADLGHLGYCSASVKDCPSLLGKADWVPPIGVATTEVWIDLVGCAVEGDYWDGPAWMAGSWIG